MPSVGISVYHAYEWRYDQTLQRGEDGPLPGPVFGHIPGYPVGSRFENRAALAEARVHRHRQAGISGSATKGADSIVLSGGYEDDQDLGNLIIYTGYGGRDPATGRQIFDQPFRLWNRALAYSSLNGLPVRVIRGEGHESRYSPSAGYRYDGLYRTTTDARYAGYGWKASPVLTRRPR